MGANVINVHLLYLSVQGNSWLHLLSIPLADAQRLSYRLFKWLRFLVYAICGAKGHISTGTEGDEVDYDNTLSAQFQAGDYYYLPIGDFHFVDPRIVDEKRSLIEDSRCSTFRRTIIQRDGNRYPFTKAMLQVFLGMVIPSKAILTLFCRHISYISVLAQSRAHLYNVDQAVLDTVGSDSIENGILLATRHHGAFRHGDCAILKTPNFALNTDDIPHDGPVSTTRYTLQHFTLWEGRPNPDAQFRGTEDPQLWSLFLALRKWSSGEKALDIPDELAAANILAQVAELSDQPLPEGGAINDGDPSATSFVSSNVDQDASGPGAAIPPELSQAMDRILALQYFLAGTTPQAVAEKRQKAAEEIERQREAKLRAIAVAWVKDQIGDDTLRYFI
ncbi:hypothetical protein BOTBODRAFT_180628 [Botryobasidium botryosum FD-172 SS1]|uniref:HNH nuclease domain-containing protein n=1 Tax=Botryobasidium botryosum (strain FD-172 SS1) TaxID=930990 RepID=A0A067M6N8_BOTB1|nr:hypothetical protein BOTBODRAFT_180628 [Botryobasidium botryosum FD-172 SS1]